MKAEAKLVTFIHDTRLRTFLPPPQDGEAPGSCRDRTTYRGATADGL